MNRYQNTVGIVINKKKFKESDLIITLLTPTLGKITCFAKNVRNIKSTRLASLQLGNTIKAHLYQKNGFSWLSESQTTTSFMHHPKNLAQLNLLFYLLEIINRLIADNQHIDNVYPVCQNIINAISLNRIPAYIQNEIQLIKLLGFGLPPEITESYAKADYPLCQKLIRHHFESIIEKPFESNKLFR